MHILTIGIAGGSGSGKTTIAQKITEKVGRERISFIEMDSYYRDLSHLSHSERSQYNFDHPAALDIELFIEHLKMLKAGVPIEKPEYDFVTHTRKRQTTRVFPQPVVIIEGLLLFENKRVRELLDIKTYVETPADIRFIRRLIRDMKERGRSAESVVNQYYKTVRPMHQAFVEPGREYADIIIPWQDYNDVAIEVVFHRVEAKLTQQEKELNFVGIDGHVADHQSIRTSDGEYQKNRLPDTN